MHCHYCAKIKPHERMTSIHDVVYVDSLLHCQMKTVNLSVSEDTDPDNLLVL